MANRNVVLTSSVTGPPFKCPECEREFPRRQSLGYHRRKAHDVQSEFTKHYLVKLAKRAKASAKTAKIATSDIDGPPFRCPECNLKFGKVRWLGAHRKSMHGINGTSPATKWRRAKIKAANGELKKSAKRIGGKSNGVHHDQSIHEPEHEAPNGGQEFEFEIGAAFGHTQAWLEHYAISVGLPPSVLAVRIAELLRRSAMRSGMGPTH